MASLVFVKVRSTTDQIFTLRQIFEKSWDYAKDVFACFVDLEKAYDRIPRYTLSRVLQDYGINGCLLMAIKSFYCQFKVCVHVNGKQSKSFHVGCWSSARVCFVTFPFHNLHELDGQAQPNRWVCHDRKMQNYSAIFRRWFSVAGFVWIWPPTRIKWLCSCMWHCWNEN